MAKTLTDSPKTKEPQEFSFGFPSSGDLYQVSQLKWWIFEQLTQDRVSTEELELAQQIIAEYEALQSKHEQCWLNQSCGDKELLSSWQSCYEANQRWEVLRATLNVVKNLSQAYEVAFHHFQSEQMGVDTSEREILLDFLRAQQRMNHTKRKIKSALQAYEPEYSRMLQWEEPKLYYQGRPLELPLGLCGLMTALIGGSVRLRTELLREVFGSPANNETTRGRMSRKVHELNIKLEELLGKPPNGQSHWITGTGGKNHYTYTFLNPNLLPDEIG